MMTVWLSLAAAVFLAGLVHICAPAFPAALAAACVHALLVPVLLRKQPRYVLLPMTAGLALRGGAAVFDGFTSLLSNMSIDTGGYFMFAKGLVDGVKYTGFFGGKYGRMLSWLFAWCGTTKAMAVYINILFGLTSIWFLYKCLDKIKAPRRLRILLLWALALFPYSVYYSSVLLREAMVGTFAAAALYCALCWMEDRQARWVLLCAGSLLAASAFHAGALFLIIGFALFFTFYSHQKGRLTVGRKSLCVLAAVLAGLALLALLFPGVFLEIFSGRMNLRGVLYTFNMHDGGSAYLTWLNAENLWDVIRYSPLKLFYFLFAPLPWDWRGLKDAASFLIDSLSYLCCYWVILKNTPRSGYKWFLLPMLLGLLVTLLAYGLGAWTAGAAIRHRNKFFPLLLILVALAKAPAGPENAGKQTEGEKSE